MIERAVQYLKKEQVAFRLISFPMPEPLPSLAFALPPNARRLETRLAFVGPSVAVVCAASGDRIDLDELSRELDLPVTEATSHELLPPFTDAPGPIPPLGRLLGLPVFVDQGATAGLLVFAAFGDRDFIELSYDDFALVEHPRIARFAVAGALPPYDATAARR